MQTIGSTFNAYRNPGLSSNIYDPLSNIVAALNYILARYGSLEAVFAPRRGGWYGYAVGTRNVPQDMLAMIHEGEAILPRGQNPYAQSGGDYLGEIGNKIGSAVLSNFNEVQSLKLGNEGISFEVPRSGPSSDTYNNNNSQNSWNPTIIVQSEEDGHKVIQDVERYLHRVLVEAKNTMSTY